MALFPSPRIRLHEVFERGKSNTSTLLIYEDAEVVIPTSAKFTLINDSGEIVVSGAATISGGGELSFLVSSSDIPNTLSFSDNYLIEWEPVIAGKTYLFRRSCALARSKLYPCISDIDLLQSYSDLNSILPSSKTSWQSYITEAFIQIIERLRANGNFEYLIISSAMLRQIHLDCTFMLIWRDMDSSGLGEGRYLQLSVEHRRAYESGFKRLVFKYDESENGIATNDKLRAQKSVIYTSNPPYYGRRRW